MDEKKEQEEYFKYTNQSREYKLKVLKELTIPEYAIYNWGYYEGKNDKRPNPGLIIFVVLILFAMFAYWAVGL